MLDVIVVSQGIALRPLVMVHTSLEKLLKIEKVWGILEKSLYFCQKSLSIFESALNKNNFHWKKNVLRKGMIESTAMHKNFLGDHESVFFIWFQCSQHILFSVTWITLGTVP